MTRTRIEGRVVNCMISCSGVDIASSFKYFRWRERADRVEPQTVANTVTPVGWKQGHRWTECELGIMSEADDAFSGYVAENSDNTVIASGILIKALDHLNTGQFITVNSPIVDWVESGVEDFETTITVYHMKAYYIEGPRRI